MSIEIRKVKTRRELQAFIQFRYDLYRGDPYDVPYLRFDELRTLRSDRNAAFEDCIAAYFLAYRDGKAVGRVAAIINARANEHWQKKVVRFGWFDFIDDYEVSSALLHTVEEWGRERGMDSIVGPMGFTDTDREGMLVEGFDSLATMYANHNYDYYPRHIDHYGGFAKDNDYVEMLVRVPDQIPEKIAKVAQIVEQRSGLRVHKLTRKELIFEGYGREVFSMLNETYKDLYGFARLSNRKIDQLVRQYIRIADLNLVSIIVDTHAGNKMVGFGITFPSFSEAMQKTRDGRFLPFGWWHLLKVLKWHKTPLVDLLLIGVLPEYRGKGANALIFDDLIRWFQRYHFEYAITGPQMESNEGVLSQWQYLEATPYRRHRCYRKLL